VWSDALFAAERSHLLQLVAWAAASAIVGTIVLLVLGRRSPLLWHFGVQMTLWGTTELLLSLGWWRALAMRDVAGATRLTHAIWFVAGLETGFVALGATVALVGWRAGYRLGAVGAGLAIVVQGLALLVLALRFATVVTGVT
jgi:hypothetical protein